MLQETVLFFLRDHSDLRFVIGINDNSKSLYIHSKVTRVKIMVEKLFVTQDVLSIERLDVNLSPVVVDD